MVFSSREIHPFHEANELTLCMKLKPGQFVFLRKGVNLEVVTFVRHWHPQQDGVPVTCDTAIIRRRRRRIDEMVMLADLSPIPSGAGALMV